VFWLADSLAVSAHEGAGGLQESVGATVHAVSPQGLACDLDPGL
jgi:hypothetical protein